MDKYSKCYISSLAYRIDEDMLCFIFLFLFPILNLPPAHHCFEGDRSIENGK